MAAELEIDKPSVLIDLRQTLMNGFTFLKSALHVDDTYTLNLKSIDINANAEYSDRELVAAVTLRKVQALWVLTDRGVQTRNDVVIALCADIVRTLMELFPGAGMEHLEPSMECPPEVDDLVVEITECGRTVASLTLNYQLVVFRGEQTDDVPNPAL